MPAYIPQTGQSTSLILPISSGEGVTNRPQKRQRTQSSNSTVAGAVGNAQHHQQEFQRAAYLQQAAQQQAAQQQQQQSAAALKNGIGPGGGGGGGVQKYSTNGYLPGGGHKAAGVTGGNASGMIGTPAKQQQQPPQGYMRSPSITNAHIHNTPSGMGSRGGGVAAATVPAASSNAGDVPSFGMGGGGAVVAEEPGLSSLRVREENGTETFAVPLGIANTWEVGLASRAMCAFTLWHR